MLFKQMEYFVAVIEHNSFTKAAEYCYISQSAISQQIQALEDDLGVKLLNRLNRKFILTTAGEYFYQKSKELLRDVDSIKKDIIRLANDDFILRIGYLKSASGRELQETIASFARLFPEVTFKIVSGTHEELHQLLVNNDLDAVISNQRRAFSDDYINFELVRLKYFVEISIQNSLSECSFLDIEKIKKLPCILITANGQEKIEKEYFQNILGFKGSFIFANSLDEARIMVAANQGILPIARLQQTANDVVKRIPLYKETKQMWANCCIFWHKQNHNDYINKLAELLQELLINTENG